MLKKSTVFMAFVVVMSGVSCSNADVKTKIIGAWNARDVSNAAADRKAVKTYDFSDKGIVIGVNSSDMIVARSYWSVNSNNTGIIIEGQVCNISFSGEKPFYTMSVSGCDFYIKSGIYDRNIYVRYGE